MIGVMCEGLGSVHNRLAESRIKQMTRIARIIVRMLPNRSGTAFREQAGRLHVKAT